MKETDMKAAVHGALALASLVESFDSRSRVRKLLTGCVFGWHLYAVYFHLFVEEAEVGQKISLDKEIEFW